MVIAAGRRRGSLPSHYGARPREDFGFLPKRTETAGAE
jgi:hypothetical protein